MEKGGKFETIKVRHSLECLNQADKDFLEPTERRKRTPNLGGFFNLRLSAFEGLWCAPVAYPIKGQKSRHISTLNRLADMTAMHTHHLLNSFQGLTCKPGRGPKLNYTDTSLDSKGQVSQSPLGGRGLTYFFLTYCLPCSYCLQSINFLGS